MAKRNKKVEETEKVEERKLKTIFHEIYPFEITGKTEVEIRKLEQEWKNKNKK